MSKTSFPLRWPTVRSRRWLESFLEQAISDGDVMAVVAIGSSVRPDVQSNDLDLLVVRNGPAVRVDSPIEVDIRQYEASEIDGKLREGHDLVGWAARFGAALFERDRFWERFVSRHRGHIPLPSAQVARDRSRKAQSYVEGLLEAGDEDAAAEQLVSMLTHLARAALVEKHVFPASRPELPGQLRMVGEQELADALEHAIYRDKPVRSIYFDIFSPQPR